MVPKGQHSLIVLPCLSGNNRTLRLTGFMFPAAASGSGGGGFYFSKYQLPGNTNNEAPSTFIICGPGV